MQYFTASLKSSASRPDGLQRRSVVMPGLLCILVAAAMAQADTLVLKEEALVKGPKVTLGEVADIEGENAEFLATVEVAPAAMPGDSKCLGAGLVTARLHSAGLDPADIVMKGARSVTATTRCLEVTPEMIEEDLRRFILLEMPWDPLETEIEVAAPQQEARVPDGELEVQWRPDPTYRYLGTGSFRGTVTVDGAHQKTFLCKAKIETYGDVVVAASDIPRGRPLSPRNLRTETRALSTLSAPAFRRPEELVGYIARRTIFPGQVISMRHVVLPTLVKRNQIVTVEARAGRLQIQGQARAVSEGAAGDLVRCENLNSKEEFQGMVREDGVVVVP